MKVTAVIPAYNEEKVIAEVINKTKEYVDEVIVIDDCSKDKTYENAINGKIKCVKLLVNMGTGFATRTGCEIALNNDADIIVTLDGDGQHDPAEIPKLINTLKENRLDVVFGSRPANDAMPFIKRIGNRGLSLISNFLFSTYINDTQTGFHVFTKEAYKKIKWTSCRYSMVSEISAYVGGRNLRYREVPIKTIYTNKIAGMSKRDAMIAAMKMFWWRIKGW